MASLFVLGSSLMESRQILLAAIASASANWERRPASGVGEEAWSARQAAEHVIASDLLFSSRACRSAGKEGLEITEHSYATAAEARAGLVKSMGLVASAMLRLKEGDLAAEDSRWGTVEGVLTHNLNHLREHTAQITAAAGR